MQEHTTSEYERDMFIDHSALDVEWLGQAMLMMKYSGKLASAEREVARIKEKMSVEEARLEKDIRTDPHKYGVGDIKMTEAVAKAAIVSNKGFQKLKEELIDSQYEASMLKGAVEAIKQRKDGLQDLVRLHGQQYFAGPTMPRNLSHEVEQKMLKEKSNQAIKITRRRA